MSKAIDQISFVFNGHVPAKKNSKRRAFAGGRVLMLPSKPYMAWEKRQISAIGDKVRPMKPPYAISATYFPGDLRAFDLSNSQESIHDLLVKLGVLEDDNFFVLHSFTCELGGMSKGEARVEVTVASLEPSEFDLQLATLRNKEALKAQAEASGCTQKSLRETLWQRLKVREVAA